MEQVDVQPMNLSAMIEAYLKQKHQEVEEAKQRAAADAAAQHRQTLAAFRAWLDNSFSSALLAALKPGQIGINDCGEALLVFSYGDMKLIATWKGDRVWIATEGSNLYQYPAWNDSTCIAVLASLQDTDQFRQRQIEEYAKEQADARAMHERCRARVAQARTAVVPWTWPRLRDITIACWRWCTAPAGDGGEPDYATGCSLQTRLPDNGMLHLKPDHQHATERTLMLPESAIPIASLVTASRTEELPVVLIQHRTLAIPGIRESYDQYDDDGHPMLVEDDKATLTIQLERWPIAWVRDALMRP